MVGHWVPNATSWRTGSVWSVVALMASTLRGRDNLASGRARSGWWVSDARWKSQQPNSERTRAAHGRDTTRTRPISTLTCVYTGSDTGSTRREVAYHALKQRLLQGDFAP